MQRLENARKEIGISNTDDKPLKQNIDVNWWHSGLWHGSGQPHKKYPSWNKNSLMDIFKWFLQFSEKSIPAHTLNDRYTAYSFFYKSFSSFYQIVYPISLGYNKSF